MVIFLIFSLFWAFDDVNMLHNSNPNGGDKRQYQPIGDIEFPIELW